mgnify:CR=1 FL=1
MRCEEGECGKGVECGVGVCVCVWVCGVVVVGGGLGLGLEQAPERYRREKPPRSPPGLPHPHFQRTLAARTSTPRPRAGPRPAAGWLAGYRRASRARMLLSFDSQRKSLVFTKGIPQIFPSALRAPG